MIQIRRSHQLNTDQSGYQEQEKNKKREENQHQKIVSHRKPDETAKAGVRRWPGNSRHPGKKKHERYNGDAGYCVPLAAWGESVLFIPSDHYFDTEDQGDVSNQKNSCGPSVSLIAKRNVCSAYQEM